MKLGDYLRQRREALGWTQPEASVRAEVEQSYISKLETGRSYPSEEVYGRLLKAYEIDTSDLVDRVDASELERLKDVQTVRAALLDQTRKARSLSRTWLITGVAGLALGGACLGAGISAERIEYTEHFYRSQGLLAKDENLQAFSAVRRSLNDTPRAEAPPEIRAALQAENELILEMRNRLDPEDRILRTSHGDSFIENLPEGRRYFEKFDERTHAFPSPLRWLIAPGLALVLGALGCFFTSTRWK